MSTAENDKELKITADSLKVFMTYGIKSMTMDDIARQLRMSKKTLYQYVKDKNELVNKCLDFDCQSFVLMIDEVVSRGLNAIEENFEMSSRIIEEIKNIHPSIFYDLEKYYPEALMKMHNAHHEHAAKVMSNNLKKGIEEGFYRKDFDIPVMTRLWVSRLNAIFDPSMFPMEQFRLDVVYQEMFIHHIRGIASKKGLEYLEHKLELK